MLLRFIKHYSPFCHFCLELAPTWKELAEKKSKEYPGLLHFGEVDCVATGDLCSANNVSAFPELQWYKYPLSPKKSYKHRFVDGKKVTSYPLDEERDFDTLSKYVDTHIKAYFNGENLDPSPTKGKSQVSTQSIPNPNGISVSLTSESFNQHISPTPSKSTGAGWFVKFYVPWCTHCKHMADAWTEMAREMKGKLNIGEVNCDAEAKLCKDMKLRGYPSLIFFKGGEKAEYDGLRGLGDLISFAGKAGQ
jgi:protein disulfide-isomerase